jgi:mRNA interferase MazF
LYPSQIPSSRLAFAFSTFGRIPSRLSRLAKSLSQRSGVITGQPLPDPFSYQVAWAKCDMLATVGFERLDLFHTARDQTGKRRYLHPKLTDADLERVKAGVLNAIGFRNLTRDRQY